MRIAGVCGLFRGAALDEFSKAEIGATVTALKEGRARIRELMPKQAADRWRPRRELPKRGRPFRAGFLFLST